MQRADEELDDSVALNYVQWDGGAHCGKQITIQYGGRTQTATIADQCLSCGGYGGIDLTPGLADAFGMRDSGIVQATWNFGSGQPQQQPSSSSSQRPWSSSSTSSSNTWRPSSSSSTWTPSSSSSRSSSSSYSSSSSPTSTRSSSTSSSSSSYSSSITSSNSTSLASTSAGNSYVTLLQILLFLIEKKPKANLSHLRRTAAATSSIFANSTAVVYPSAASSQGGSLSQVNRFVIQMVRFLYQPDNRICKS